MSIPRYYAIYRDRSIEVAGIDCHPGPWYPFAVRLDKFLKVARLSRRRSEAHEALQHGRIERDGRALKPGYQVKRGDVLEIHYATKFVKVLIKRVPEKVRPGIKTSDLYEVIAQRSDEPSAWVR